MNDRKKAMLYYASLLGCLVLLFGLTAVLYILQKNEPVFTGPTTTPVFYALVAVAGAFLGIMLLFGRNAMAADIRRKHAKLLAGSEPFVQSARTAGNGEDVIGQVKKQLRADGFQIMENVDLHPDAQTALAVRIRYHIARDYLTEYVFLIRCDSQTAYSLDFTKATEIVEGMTKKGFKLFRQGNSIALCVFVDGVEEKLAQDAMDIFSPEMLYLLAAYDIANGRVYFMNNKATGGRFAKLQGLVQKYIAGY